MCDVEFCFYSKHKNMLEKLHKEFFELYSWLPPRNDNMRMFFLWKKQFDTLQYCKYRLWSCDQKIMKKQDAYYFYIDVCSDEFDDNYEIISCMCNYVQETYNGDINVVYSSDINGHYTVTTNDKEKRFFDEFARLSYCLYDENDKIIKIIDKEFASIKEAEDFIKNKNIEKVDEAYDFLTYDYRYEEYNANESSSLR